MMQETYLLLLLLGLPLLCSVFFFIASRRPLFIKYGAVIFPVAICFLTLILLVKNFYFKNFHLFSADWFTLWRSDKENIVFSLSLSLSRKALLMALTTSVTALLVFIFSIAYMKGSSRIGFYFGVMSFFLFAMFGFIFADNLLFIFLFWELLSFASFLLIGFDLEKNRSATASLKSFLATRIGDAGFLAALLFLWKAFGTFELSEMQILWQQNQSLEVSNLVFFAGIGLLTAVASKAAQFPFQTWLPDAMAAPTPVSALLHAATLVAAGIYLLIRIFPLLTSELLTVTTSLGALGAVGAAFIALYQKNIKCILAWSTISQLGFMLCAVGGGSPDAAMLHLVFHAFFKAGMFLCIGAIVYVLRKEAILGKFRGDPENTDTLGGLGIYFPFILVVQAVCSLALVGLPLFSGFLSKEAILSAVWMNTNAGFFRVIIFSILLVSAFLTALYTGKLFLNIFFGPSVLEKKPLRSSFFILFPLGAVAIFSFIFPWALHPFSLRSGWLSDVLPSVEISDRLPYYVALLPALLGLSVAFILFKIKNQKNMFDLRQSLLYNFFAAGFGFDALQQRAVISPVVWLSRMAAFFDQTIIDGFVNFLAKATVVKAHILSVIDKVLVDGIFNGTAKTIGFVGRMTASIQNGKVQFYIFTALAVILLMWFLF